MSTVSVSVSDTIHYLKQHNYYDLAFLIEETWKRHPAKSTDSHNKQYEMWKEQLGVNLPLLYLTSIYLHSFVEERNIKHLLFASRDCIHWYRIYKLLYPNSNVHYFHCSRKMFENARTNHNKFYESYINTITNNDIKSTIYIDIHGTGKRMYDYFKSEKHSVPACFILSSGHSSSDNLSDDIKRLMKHGRCEFIVFKAAGTPIEVLNYDLIGSCIDYNKDGDVRLPLEYEEKFIKEYHTCADTFLNILKSHSSMIAPDRSKSELRKTINYLFQPILSSSPIVTKWFAPERKHGTTI